MRILQLGVLFLAGQERRECCVFTSDVEIRGNYLSLTLGTAEFKQLDISIFFYKKNLAQFQID